MPLFHTNNKSHGLPQTDTFKHSYLNHNQFVKLLTESYYIRNQFLQFLSKSKIFDKKFEHFKIWATTAESKKLFLIRNKFLGIVNDS